MYVSCKLKSLLYLLKLYKPTQPMKYKARLGFPPITPKDCAILNDV